MRGRTVSLFQQSVVFGQMVVFFVNYFIAKGMAETLDPESWLALDAGIGSHHLDPVRGTDSLRTGIPALAGVERTSG
ncbi:hypothetical protein [Cobetia sp. ICG0124]|uniref:hypothetical protein n=1 Tax=Cobetia sp. ICG0124 TaxID=2053669 RepID=UPI00196B2ABF|nr:hypothetical protein [Cobetia sp. ICG0124]